MSIRIEPCPFCGEERARTGSNATNYVTIEPHDPSGNLTVNMDGFGWYWVCCGNCNAQGPKYHGEFYGSGNTGPKNFRRDKDKTAAAIKTAVDAWNVRAQPTLFGTLVDGDGEVVS